MIAVESQLPIPRTTLTALVAAYQQAERDIRTAYAMLDKVEADMRGAMLMNGTSTMYFNINSIERSRYHGHGAPDYKDPDGTMKMVHRQMWRVLIERMELRSLMSIKQATELDKQLETGEGLPPITEANILAMMEGTLTKIPQFMAEAVGEVFNWLRPHRWNEYKTNQKFEIGSKVIKEWCLQLKWNGGGFDVRHDSQKALTALDNVFHLLDGKGSVKTYRGPLCDAINQQGAKGETEYFAFKCFRNGNLHLKFKRLDLLAKLNAEGGGKMLKEEPA